MKLKEIKRTAIQSWSPAQHHPIYLATGTSAQQLDASFSTNASLEFFELDLSEPTLDMKSCGSLSSSHRYHKLVWGPFGMDADSRPSGVLIAGGENGNVILYDPARIMEGHTDVVIAESDLHTGPVRALDVNPFQTNLFASGGNDSEIYIWDMNNFGSPMTPGPKTQPQEDISCVAWNRQVQHILASASPSGRASVWDLRKNDLIIKVSDHSNRMHCSGLAWNPEVATQMVLSSEDDRMPVIQMWDLRFATSPLKVLEHHTRGVLGLAWSLADPDLLLSCGKDNQILCWNPNTGEVLYELPTSSQWCFDIQWCPRNPAVLSAAGFDGHIDIYSIMGGSSQAQSQRHADQISNSFGNMDPFGTGQALPPLQLPQTSTPPASVNPLKKPPKWIRRPVGASFAFGGKLVSLENSKPDPQQVPQPSSHVVHVSQVVTETDFLRRSEELQATLSSGGFVNFCQGKIESAEDQFEKTVWSFLKANFESDVRGKYLELLGYNKEELALKISAALEVKPVEPPTVHVPLVTTQPLPNFSLLPPADTPEAAFDLIAAANLQPEAELEPLSIPELQVEDLTAALEVHLEEEEEEAALHASVNAIIEEEEEEEEEDEEEEDVEKEQLEEEEGEEISLEEETAPQSEDLSPFEVLASVDDPVDPPVDPPVEIPSASFDCLAPVEISAPLEIPTPVEVPTPIEVPPPSSTPAGGVGQGCLSISQDVDGLITQALLTGDFEGAVELCLHDNRMADSIILAIAGGAELLEKTQKKYFTKTHSKISKLISAVVMKDWTDILRTCDLQSWKEALAAVMTYAKADEFSSLCDLLGGRLEEAEDPELNSQACLSYICAGNVERLVSCWSRAHQRLSPLSLQDLVEKVVILRQAVEQTQRSGPASIGLLLAERMSHYAGLLASQGSLSTAISYLPDNSQQVSIQQLRARLSRALGECAAAVTTPSAPAQTQQVPVKPAAPVQPMVPAAQPMVPAAQPMVPVAQPMVPAVQPMVPAVPAVQPAPALPRHPYAPVQPAPMPSSAPAPPQYYQPVRAASTVTSWSNQTPTALPHVPPPPQGGAPEQQGDAVTMFGVPAPGSAAPPAGPAAPAYMYSQQYQPYSQPGHFPHTAGAAPAYHLHHYSSSSSSTVEPSSPPPPPAGFLSHYTSQPPPLYPGPQCPSSLPPPFYSSSSGASFQNVRPGSPVAYTSLPPPPHPPPASGTQTGPDNELVHDSQRAGPQNGWNDPPSFTRASKKKTQPENYARPAPIMAPIMAPLGPGPQAPVGPQGVPRGSFPGSQQPLAPPPINPGTPRTSTEGPPGAPTGDVITNLQSIPAEKITKKPIPEEHLVLKTTFEGLIHKCLAVASDPQTKRKLDDANKRLEVLYDKLREQTLSPSIVGGLHNMARSMEARCYADGLNIHTHIVSSSNFSETSAFMPVLKVVLTQANKLGV